VGLGSAALVLAPGSASASAAPAAPGNDSFASAVVMAGASGTLTGTNIGATGQGGEPINRGPGPIRSVWYRWTAPNGGWATFDTCTPPVSNAYDSTIGIYTGTQVSALTRVVDDDDTCIPRSLVVFIASAGTTYDISVDGWGGATGNFVLTWSLAPPNDAFADAQTITGNAGSVPGTNLFATEEAGEPENENAAHPLASVWYRWVAPNSGIAAIDTCTAPASKPFDTTIGAYEGSSVEALTQLATNDDFCDSRSSLALTVVGGQTYYVSVDGYNGADSEGNFVLAWSLPQPTVSVGDVSAVEGSSGVTAFDFTVSLSTVSTQAITVEYATADGTATAPSDYTASSGTVPIDPGQPSATVAVDVAGDATFETAETFVVNLTGASGATVEDGTGLGTITDDDPPPSLSVDDPVVTEGNSGITVAAFTVTLAGATERTATVDFATSDGTATAPDDYGAVGGTLTFLPGQTSQPVLVPVSGDTDPEADETFFLGLSNATDASIADGQGQGTIADDDSGADVSVSIADSPDPVQVGTNLTYTVTVVNGGPNRATGVSLVDTAPGGPAFVSLSWTQGTCSGTSTIVCDLRDIDAGSSATVTLVLTPSRTASLTDSALASAAQSDPNPANNSDSEDTAAVPNGSGCTIVGSSGDDVITGTADSDVICGLDGNDTLDGSTGRDTVRGGAGDDEVSGGDGNDTLTGGVGADSLMGGTGKDLMQGGPGDDTLAGGTQLDTASYLADPAGVTALMTPGSVTDGFGNTDTLTGVEIVQGSDFGDDDLTGSTGRNGLWGNGGNDTLRGLAGNDVLNGGAGTDTLDGGPGVDTCSAGETVTNCEAAGSLNDLSSPRLGSQERVAGVRSLLIVLRPD
jgi:uncharacterized repeat protein (TIGR01451 family)